MAEPGEVGKGSVGMLADAKVIEHEGFGRES